MTKRYYLIRISIVLSALLFYSTNPFTFMRFKNPLNHIFPVILDSIQTKSDEIIFISGERIFSPVITLEGKASVRWTWMDNTSDSSTKPIKNYGSEKIRANRLKVTPWSAVRRINIGYDAEDGGSESIELVNDQQVLAVKNLELVAPYLREWCSSYNRIESLDFSNFVNLETIECFKSFSLAKINLNNTPKLRRICFEGNNLINLDLSECPALEDIRAALNNYTTIKFSTSTQKLWHICVRDNKYITNHHLFNNLMKFPNIAELYIWNMNQKGPLTIHSTKPSRVEILGANNKYTSIDFTGALQNTSEWGIVNLKNNNLNSVNIKGCVQIKELDLSHNKLKDLEIDHILQQLDAFNTWGGKVDLTFNQPPTARGVKYLANLKTRSWIILVDLKFSVKYFIYLFVAVLCIIIIWIKYFIHRN